jgi:hypothetical protein
MSSSSSSSSSVYRVYGQCKPPSQRIEAFIWFATMRELRAELRTAIESRSIGDKESRRAGKKSSGDSERDRHNCEL